mmetsp:Transcript_23488/g.55647  ORF Transcript_23488/g.55647 Transcript_23488/m.55647 type:complete len:793 (+) Transcript_23488:161-2539(+)|eukprot:CAMPEP_0113444338 /NCGR_PEP_ID=MMETSP0014_2-20120614/2615_1 /TAXON_ID=2857 /ORGANISM="Nitzschia sp." /LENGTH=792 /DNA_ID=CAMNT_0000335347 /DNA_START=9 /DNA_END=2387 /DNA_ORIENTATION=+ /assembly_acc=CAM_ASM_000159
MPASTETERLGPHPQVGDVYKDEYTISRVVEVSASSSEDSSSGFYGGRFCRTFKIWTKEGPIFTEKRIVTVYDDDDYEEEDDGTEYSVPVDMASIIEDVNRKYKEEEREEARRRREEKKEKRRKKKEKQQQLASATTASRNSNSSFDQSEDFTAIVSTDAVALSFNSSTETTTAGSDVDAAKSVTTSTTAASAAAAAAATTSVVADNELDGDDESFNDDESLDIVDQFNSTAPTTPTTGRYQQVANPQSVTVYTRQTKPQYHSVHPADKNYVQPLGEWTFPASALSACGDLNDSLSTIEDWTPQDVLLFPPGQEVPSTHQAFPQGNWATTEDLILEEYTDEENAKTNATDRWVPPEVIVYPPGYDPADDMALKEDDIKAEGKWSYDVGTLKDKWPPPTEKELKKLRRMIGKLQIPGIFQRSNGRPVRLRVYPNKSKAAAALPVIDGDADIGNNGMGRMKPIGLWTVPEGDEEDKEVVNEDWEPTDVVLYAPGEEPLDATDETLPSGIWKIQRNPRWENGTDCDEDRLIVKVYPPGVEPPDEDEDDGDEEDTVTGKWQYPPTGRLKNTWPPPTKTVDTASLNAGPPPPQSPRRFHSPPKSPRRLPPPPKSPVYTSPQRKVGKLKVPGVFSSAKSPPPAYSPGRLAANSPRKKLSSISKSIPPFGHSKDSVSPTKSLSQKDHHPSTFHNSMGSSSKSTSKSSKSHDLPPKSPRRTSSPKMKSTKRDQSDHDEEDGSSSEKEEKDLPFVDHYGDDDDDDHDDDDGFANGTTTTTNIPTSRSSDPFQAPKMPIRRK